MNTSLSSISDASLQRLASPTNTGTICDGLVITGIWFSYKVYLINFVFYYNLSLKCFNNKVLDT